MSEFIKVAKLNDLNDLAPGEKMLVDYEGEDVGLIKLDHEVYAISDICTESVFDAADAELTPASDFVRGVEETPRTGSAPPRPAGPRTFISLPPMSFPDGGPKTSLRAHHRPFAAVTAARTTHAPGCIQVDLAIRQQCAQLAGAKDNDAFAGVVRAAVSRVQLHRSRWHHIYFTKIF